MKRRVAALSWLVCAGWLTACAATPPPVPPDDKPRIHAVRVVSNGFHTAIVVPRPGLVATGLLPEAGDFPNAKFLEFGWGDRTYYPAEKKTLGMTLEAALTPTRAVMHMAGLARAPQPSHAGFDMVIIAVTQGQFRQLVDAIGRDFERPDGRRATPVSRGLYRNSYFYDAHGTFHLFNTCNTWTARKLRAGGVNLSPFGIITADQLMEHLRSAITTTNPRATAGHRGG